MARAVLRGRRMTKGGRIGGLLLLLATGGCAGHLIAVADGAPDADAAAPSDLLPIVTVPDALKLPESGQSLLFWAAASGVQIYTCTSNAGDGGVADLGPTYAWVFKAPQATLTDSQMHVVGMHSAG